jgi:cell division septum initiation protein DivIVA
MSGTNKNAFKADVEDAYQVALRAVSQLKTEMDELVAKMEEDASAAAPVVEQQAAQVAAPVAADVEEEAAGPGAGSDEPSSSVPDTSTKSK